MAVRLLREMKIKLLISNKISAKDLYSLQKTPLLLYQFKKIVAKIFIKSVTITLDGQAHPTNAQSYSRYWEGSGRSKSIGIAFTDKAHNIIELKNQVLLNSLIINEYNLILWPMLKANIISYSKIKRYSYRTISSTSNLYTQLPIITIKPNRCYLVFL